MDIGKRSLYIVIFVLVLIIMVALAIGGMKIYDTIKENSYENKIVNNENLIKKQ